MNPRRHFRFFLLLLAGCTSLTPATSQKSHLEILESKSGGKLGVFAVNTTTGEIWERRADERFLMCSTFKLLLAAQVLKRVDDGVENLDRAIPYDESDLLSYAPVTRANVGKKHLKIRELAAAAVQVSDNTAANLLLKTQGGPQGLTEFLRQLGDRVTHLDRFEPELNNSVGGKDLDSTTPRAMARTIEMIFREGTLKPASLALLKEWLLTNTTSTNRVKAGLPSNWKVANKTGTGPQGNVNDVGVIYKADGSSIFFAAFVSESKKPTVEDEATLAAVAREIAQGESRR